MTRVTRQNAVLTERDTPFVPIEKHRPSVVGYAAALSAAIDEADAVGGVVTHTVGETYIAEAAVTKTDVAARIDWAGARVVRSAAMANAPVLQLNYSNSAPQSVTGLTNTTYTFGDGSTTTPSTRIEVASAAGWAAGDWAVIVGDDAIVGAIASEGQREGERVQILAVSGNYLYTARPLRVTLTTVIRVARLTQKACVLTDPWFEDAAGSPTSRNQPALIVSQAVKPRIIRARGENLQGECVLFLGCAAGTIDGSDMHNLRTSLSDAAYGYGFHLSSCNDFEVRGVRGSNLRHLVTTGARKTTTAGSTDLWRFGSSLGHRYIGCNGGEGGHSLLDTHDDSAYNVFQGCFVGWSHREPSGSYFAYKIRGRQNILKDSASIGAGGVVLQAEDGGGGHQIINHTHIATSEYGANQGGFRVDYGNCASRHKATISGSVVATSGILLYANKGDVRIPRLDIAVASADAFYYPIQITDSALEIDTLVMDLRGSSGDTRIFRLLDSLSSVRVKRLVVLSGGATWRIADFSNLNGTVRIDRIECDTAPHAFEGGFSSTSGTPTKSYADMVIAGESINAGIESRTDAAVSLTTYSKATQHLAVALTAARTVTEPVYVNQAGRQIFYVRTAAATGAFAWTIGSDALTVPGSWLRRMWTGSAWVTVDRGMIADADRVSVPTHAATSKATPVDDDEVPLVDSAGSFGLKRLTWANLKAGVISAISGLDLADFTGSAVVTEAEGVLSSDNDTSLPTSAAIVDFVAQKLAKYFSPAGYVAANWYCCNSAVNSSTSVSLTADRARTTVWLVAAPVSITALAAEFTVAGDPASVFRIGVWADDGFGRPGTLLADAGSISTGSGNAGTVATGGTPGVYAATVALTLQPGIYHVGGAVQGVTSVQPTMRVVNASSVEFAGPLGTAPSGLSGSNNGWYQDGFSGALGNLTAPVRNNSATNAAPRIGFKAA